MDQTMLALERARDAMEDARRAMVAADATGTHTGRAWAKARGAVTQSARDAAAALDAYQDHAHDATRLQRAAVARFSDGLAEAVRRREATEPEGTEARRAYAAVRAMLEAAGAEIRRRADG
jgi:hypothetical protein